MNAIDPKRFHQLYGVKKPRISYQSKDFLDYVLMSLVCAAVIHVCYGPGHPMATIGIALCAVMIVTFPVRHGVELAVPVILRRPQDVLYMVAYKIRNMKPMYLVAIAVLLSQQYLIYLTPALPHQVELMRTIASWLFYLHFVAIGAYRTVILVAHLRKRGLVREVLLQTSWKSQLCGRRSGRSPARSAGRSAVVIEILHAYFTGMLTHIILIAPWYLVISYLDFSILLLPAVVIVNVITHLKYMKSYSDWFYRDHWLGHNSELEFVYLHGTHHDAIPSGLIGVSGNGYLEGFLRHSLGNPTPYYEPLLAFLLYTLEVQQDIKNHQYIPGVFPRMSRQFHEMFQHSTHHFGRLEPYSIALRSRSRASAADEKRRPELIPEEIANSIELDEQLTGFVWDNPSHRRFLELFDEYQK